MLLYSTQNWIELNRIEQNRTLTSIISNTIPYRTVQYNRTLYNHIKYRLSHRTVLHRATPPPTALPIIPLHAAQRRPSTCTYSLLLLLLLLLLVLVFFLLRWYGHHVVFAMAHAASYLLLRFLFFRYHAAPYHAIPYHTIPLLALHSNGSLLLYSTGLDWIRLSGFGLIWYGLFQVGIVSIGLVWLYCLGLDFVSDD